MKGASAEGDEPEESTTIPKAVAEDVEGMTRPRIRRRRHRLRRCNDGLEEFATKMEELAE